MAEKCFPRNRGTKKQKSARRRADSSDAPLFQHPLFGEIPLIHHSAVGRDGKVYEWWQYDPDYRPPLPRGAIPGDVRKQVYCPWHHVPKYFYVDHEDECIQCGNRFTFRATEQKYWYETLKFNFRSVPIRCLDCRRQRRSEHALREQIARTKAVGYLEEGHARGKVVITLSKSPKDWPRIPRISQKTPQETAKIFEIKRGRAKLILRGKSAI
jgi:hypothetical protein